MDINGELIRKVWDKANAIPGQDSDIFRMDVSGTWIRLKDYNNDDSVYGWTIYSLDGTDQHINNLLQLIPVHTFNNNSVSSTASNNPSSILEEPIF